MQNQVRNRHFKLYLENNIFKYFLDYRFQQLILPYKTGKIVDVAYIDTKSNGFQYNGTDIISYTSS